jgi:predicted HicB family RNase H-like nuclease
MHHGDYVAAIAYEENTGLLWGYVINLEHDALDFCGYTVDGLRAEFARSAEIYEAACRAAGREPERPGPVGE